MLISGATPMPDRIYLGGCEGAGFGTSLEWSSVAAAALDRGASCVLAHRWPIVEGLGAAVVDWACIEAVRVTSDLAGTLRSPQLVWLDDWRTQRAAAIAPHWAGLQAIGRSPSEA